MRALLATALATLLGAPAVAQVGGAPPGTEAGTSEEAGILPVPSYTGKWTHRDSLLGDLGGVRQAWADKGFTYKLDWYQSYQDIVNGGIEEGGASSTNLDYRMSFDLMRMGVLPGALVSFRAQSRFGSTVNADSGLGLPVNTYSLFPFTTPTDADVPLAITELNWLQFFGEKWAALAGKVTTLDTTNEFMGGAGRTQFMNFQFLFSPVVAQLAPYSTLAAGAVWMPSADWTVSSVLLNTTDSSTTSGFDDIGDGTAWATTADYLGSLNELPGGGTLSFFWSFDGRFTGVNGIVVPPDGSSPTVNTEGSAWAVTWSGWQYLTSESASTGVDTSNGRQDLQGLGTFLQLGIADQGTNPIEWSASGGLSGRGSIPTRDNDTWGVGYFYNAVQDDLELGPTLNLGTSTSGFEAYYDISLMPSVFLTLDAQWTESAFQDVPDATILAARLNLSL